MPHLSSLGALPQPPSLSVVLATAHPGAPLDAVLGVLLPQLAAIGGELLLIDGSPHGLPTPEARDVAITHLRRPGADVFAMRAEGVGQARGWVVAFAEDHCMPANAEWAQEVLEAHRRFGQVAAVTGAVGNGTHETPWDRGSFLLTFASVTEPFPAGLWPYPVPPPPANVSVKREAIGDEPLAPGFLEFELLPHLARAGQLAAAPSARMEHHQSHSLGWFLTHHFHNGRATGGLHAHVSVIDRVRGAWSAIALVPRHMHRLSRVLAGHPGGARQHGWAIAFSGLFLTSHAVGQLCGVLLGPGRSPAALE